MKKSIRLFTTVMVCMAMALCVSCKKDNAEPSGGGGGGTGGHEYVDLGLPSGLLWATCNVGADSPEDYGDYFAWGETTTKSTYNWSTYKWCNGDYDNLTKYCTDSDYGTVDNKTVLDPEDDAAHVNWGGAWRMPTLEEMIELWDNCTWTWTTQDGKNGYRVTGPNGSSIFLPAAGCYDDSSLIHDSIYGNYWSSSLYTVYPNGAYGLFFNSGSVYMYYGFSRNCGRSVRPVYGSQNVSVPTVTTSSVSNITQTTATCGGYVTSDGGATVTERGVCWNTEPNPTPSDSHTVDGNGIGAFISEMTGLEPGTKYYVRAYAKNAAGTSFGAERSFTTLENGGGGGGTGDHEYVDLGLPSGLLWATCNVGASKPEEYGDYYAWGEVLPYYADGHSQDNPCSTWRSMTTGAGNTVLTSGYAFQSYSQGGTSSFAEWMQKPYGSDNILTSTRDAATANWGGGWRMPTTAEWKELYDNTDCTWTIENGVAGREFTSKTDSSKYIFLPAAGLRNGTSLYYAGSNGYYWSSSLKSSSSIFAYYLYFNSGDVNPQSNSLRYHGFAVRPVR